MKRKDLIKHLIKSGCIFVREGAKHSVFFNPLIRRISSISRHNEINSYLGKKICQDLGIEIYIKK
ncbi:type II toxin-antitoxin system HicA family toxin [Patescibacteria group bacterium]|nr:type II toxin-antitoxin system HicA family toxin [Patescibacteria group bacterium]